VEGKEELSLELSRRGKPYQQSPWKEEQKSLEWGKAYLNEKVQLKSRKNRKKVCGNVRVDWRGNGKTKEEKGVLPMEEINADREFVQKKKILNSRGREKKADRRGGKNSKEILQKKKRRRIKISMPSGNKKKS